MLSIEVLSHGVYLIYDYEIIAKLTHAEYYQLQAMKNGKL